MIVSPFSLLFSHSRVFPYYFILPYFLKVAYWFRTPLPNSYSTSPAKQFKCNDVYFVYIFNSHSRGVVARLCCSSYVVSLLPAVCDISRSVYGL